MNHMNQEKSEKELKKEEAKRKKLEKFKLKQEKVQIQPAQKKDKNINNDNLIYESNTEPGEFKDLSQFPTTYSPKFVEACWYEWWHKNGYFKPEIHTSDTKFVVCLPPPNVTGTLHLGHALTTSIQDCLTRWNRMCGNETVWIPGSDHAGIATQVVVEKYLKRQCNEAEKKKGNKDSTNHSQNIRLDMGRERFVDKVWEWKDLKGHEISLQQKRMGASMDWSREYFTMDNKFSQAVVEAFVRLHDEGLIYRKKRLINWSCSLKSAISDIEVEKREITGKTFVKIPGYHKSLETGTLTYFAYKVVPIDYSMSDINAFLKEASEIIVATTRLETMLGDTGIAVNPSDPRYQMYGLNGTRKSTTHKAVHPFVSREIPIIFDESVDITFGTGAVKITPAHDFDDYEIGMRHSLPFINILTEDGRLNELCGAFSGLHRFEARSTIEKQLQNMGLLKDKKDHTMLLPICSRSKDVVEPMLMPQWFLNCDQMAKDATKVVEDGRLELIPNYHNKTWYKWMNNIRDWCISRQLWWGHRIPAYLISNDLSEHGFENKDELWFSGRTLDEARQKAINFIKEKNIPLKPENISLIQDEDVLDTWFSSALVPFASLGWPNIKDNHDLSNYFPGTLLETGHDILFFWVARMVFMSQKLMGTLPFKQVYLHAMVRDAHGRKMSKSLGNIIDPIDVINGISLESLHEKLLQGNLDEAELERAKAGQRKDFPQGIPECGTDALRFALCAYTLQGRDINLDVNRIVGYRHFCNKIWNSARFVFNAVDSWRNQSENTKRIYHMHELKNIFVQQQNGTTEKSNKSNEINGNHDLNSNVQEESIPCCKFKELDTWIFQSLYTCIEKCNAAMVSYEFPVATSALYTFWLYQFCDIYIEYVKPHFLQNNDDKSKDAETYKTLCISIMMHCLKYFLILIHPFMPYISEELYQRMRPIFNNNNQKNAQMNGDCQYSSLLSESIMIHSYPVTKEFEIWQPDNDLSEAVAFVMNVIKGIRNIRQEYNLLKTELEVEIGLNISHGQPNKNHGENGNATQPAAIDEEEKAIQIKKSMHLRKIIKHVLNLKPFVVDRVGAKSLLISINGTIGYSDRLCDGVPHHDTLHGAKNCASFTTTIPNFPRFTSSTIVNLKDLIDVEKERNKMMGRFETLKESLNALLSITSAPSYNADNISAEVLKTNQDKITQFQNEMEELTRLMSTFEA